MSSPIPLTERLELLFRVWHKSGECGQSSAAVAAAVTAGGHQVSGDEIDALRTGAGPDADVTLLAAVATHFRVPAGYLVDDDHHDLHEQLLLLELFRDERINSIQLRGARTPEDRRALLEVFRARQRPVAGRGGPAEDQGADTAGLV
ncbi:hypothetical protein [Prescottella subtropica]|uniref:hypothetical protein n=1 Tax=Prescottella subtropica TaxID=2545757 RepID=UPI0010F4D440|nr:hypothetical protein [Prescottella subtropica]